MSEIRIETGRRIFYDDLGAGQPLLLIPGLSGYRRGCMIWLAEALATRFRVISMDNRDAGESESETAYYRLADLAGDAVALLDALGTTRAHVLGHSFGGKIVLQMALDHPDRVDRLILVSAVAGGTASHCAGDPPPPEDWWKDDPVERMRWMLPAIVGPDFHARASDDEAAVIAGLERGTARRGPGRCAKWHPSVAMIYRAGSGKSAHRRWLFGGEIDEEGNGCGRRLADGIPGARLLLLAGVGHIPWVEQPDEVIPPIIDFLAGNGDDAARRERNRVP